MLTNIERAFVRETPFAKFRSSLPFRVSLFETTQRDFYATISAIYDAQTRQEFPSMRPTVYSAAARTEPPPCSHYLHESIKRTSNRLSRARLSASRDDGRTSGPNCGFARSRTNNAPRDYGDLLFFLRFFSSITIFRFGNRSSRGQPSLFLISTVRVRLFEDRKMFGEKDRRFKVAAAASPSTYVDR